MLQHKIYQHGGKIAATATSAIAYRAYQQRHTAQNAHTLPATKRADSHNKPFSSYTSLRQTPHAAAFVSLPTISNMNTMMYSVDTPRQQQFDQHQQQSQQEQQQEQQQTTNAAGLSAYIPKLSNIFSPSAETDPEKAEKQRQKALYQEKLQQMTPEERMHFEREQSKDFRARTQRPVARDTPVSKDSSMIDDGYQQVVVPCRVLPNWQPMTKEQADTPLKQAQYVAEHIFDFFRNRVDDIGWAVTGDLHELVTDPKRYDMSWETKHPLLKFNPYYEAVYRGWYDDLEIRLKFGGTIPRWNYSPWLRAHPRPKVYLDFVIPANLEEGLNFDALDEKTPERVVIQLYADLLPYSAENFLGLCDGFIDSNRFVSYNHTTVHRIDKGHAFFCGDVLRRDGSAGLAFKPNVSRRYLADENFKLPIDGPGCVVYDNSGKDTNTSHFFITQRAMPELDGRYVCFGHVVDGMGAVTKINQLPTQPDGTPLVPIEIARSGVLIQEPMQEDPFTEFRAQVAEFGALGKAAAQITPPPQSKNRMLQAVKEELAQENAFRQKQQQDEQQQDGASQ